MAVRSTISMLFFGISSRRLPLLDSLLRFGLTGE